MLGNHSSIDIPQSTEYAKEMRKWESYPSKFGAPGRPYVFQEFPKMLYKASREGGVEVINETCIVQNEEEQRRQEAKGFGSQERALDLLRREQQAHGEAAAERNYEIAMGRLSEGAAKEVRAAEAEHGASHLPEVKAKRVRRTKAQMEADRG